MYIRLVNFLFNLPLSNHISGFIKKNYNYDFVFFGSCIQYINNYDNIIKKILPSAKKHILFSTTQFFNGNNLIKDIVVKQLNYMPKLYYLYFINLDFFIELFKEDNFKIEFNQKNETSNFNMDTFKFLNIKNIKNLNILFTRKD